MGTRPEIAMEIPDKDLFRIGEVSRLTETKSFVLRYWETEFPTLQPVKSPSGHRLYRREDIETVFKIKRLLYEEGFTIAGARKHLTEQQRQAGGNGISHVAAPVVQDSHVEPPPQLPPEVTAPDSELSSKREEALRQLREELQAILTLLESE